MTFQINETMTFRFYRNNKVCVSPSSEQDFPSSFTAFLDQALHLLRARTRGDEERVWHVDDNQIVDAKTGNQPSRPRDHNSTRSLLGENLKKFSKQPETWRRAHTKVRITEYAGLTGFCGEEICERREVADIIPT